MLITCVAIIRVPTEKQ